LKSEPDHCENGTARSEWQFPAVPPSLARQHVIVYQGDRQTLRACFDPPTDEDQRRDTFGCWLEQTATMFNQALAIGRRRPTAGPEGGLIESIRGKAMRERNRSDTG
jgi:hypothetical protein